MSARVRQFLLILFTILSAVFSAPADAAPDTIADGPCSNGTHWDNIRTMCV